MKNLILCLVIFCLFLFQGKAFAVSVEACGADSKKTGQIFRGNGESIAIKAAPNNKSAKLINQVASKIFERTEYMSIDNTVTVREECTKNGWSKIQIIEPEWLKDTHIGWVPSNSLRSQKKDANGKVEFTEKDFIWRKETAPFKKIVIAGVNKVYRENARCKTIDPTSTWIASDRSTKTNPTFFVTCGQGREAFNAYFSKSDVEKGAKLMAIKNIDREVAIVSCESAVKTRANHPSTVNFDRVIDLKVDMHPSGRSLVESSFTAKNAYNLKLKYSVRCIFDEKDLLDVAIVEAKN